jgi:helix-turn-helix protein
VGGDERVRAVSRRLRDLCEPIAGAVYFVPEAREAYKALGLDDYAQGYFTSRSACLGRPSGEVVTAAFGVFNPAIVIPAVTQGWTKTDPSGVLDARSDGITQALRRILGEADPSRIVQILRGVMESVDYAGRTLFSGLRSLPFPTDPFTQLWRVCDYVRERRGDGHIAAWVAAGCDPVEISLLTELLWGLELGTYIYTRGWSKEEIEAGIVRLTEKGYVRDGAFTDEGRAYRRAIESATDAMEAVVVARLDDPDELFLLLEPLQKAVLEAKAYPVDPRAMMNRDE